MRVASAAACASGWSTPTTGTRSARWRSGSAAAVAELHATTTSLTPSRSRGADLERETAHLVERAGPVGEPRVVAEVDRVLVRQRHEQLVEDGEAAHPRVEHADRPAVHRGDDTATFRIAHIRGLPFAAVSGFTRGALLVLLATVAALLASAPALASSRQDVTITSADGTSLAATLTVPDGAVPQGGWPAVIFMHGLGQTRATGLAAAQQMGIGERYAVLAFDARGHGRLGRPGRDRRARRRSRT